MKKILVIVYLCLISNSVSAEDFFNYKGADFFYGKSQWTNIGPDASVDYEWTSANYFLGKKITPWLAFETSIGAGFLNTDDYGNSPTIEARIFGVINYKFLFLKLGGGGAHIFEDHNLPGLAPSDIHGIISGLVGIRYQFYPQNKSPIELIVGYGVEHISAPTKGGEDGDDGWNAGGLKISLSCPF